MANVLAHRFVSAKADGTDPTMIQPSNWNDGHKFTGGAAGQFLMRDPTDATYGAIWSTSQDAWVNTTATGTINNWNPTGYVPGRNTVVACSNTADLAITGFESGSPPTTGARLTILAFGNPIQIFGDHGNSRAECQFRQTWPYPQPLVLGKYGAATYQHTGGIWVLVSQSTGQDVAYVPTWGNTGTANTIGNGAINGAYRIMGPLCAGNIRLLLGSTSAPGSGAFIFSLPWPASSAALAYQLAGTALLSDVSAGSYCALAQFYGASAVAVLNADTISNGIGFAATPFPWASGDSVNIAFTYSLV